MRKTKRVTIKDIAELAGVSKATASLVLNGRSKELRVAEETRERVLAIAKEHHYQPSIHARSLRDNRSHTIGLVVPEITNYGFAVFSHELETLCREAGVQLLISCSDENPGQETVVVNNMVARQVDGLIVASSMLNDADYLKLSEQRAAAVASIFRLSGLQRDRMLLKGMGSNMPRAANDSAAGRELNRRVEIILTPKNTLVALMNFYSQPAQPTLVADQSSKPKAN